MVAQEFTKSRAPDHKGALWVAAGRAAKGCEDITTGLTTNCRLITGSAWLLSMAMGEEETLNTVLILDDEAPIRTLLRMTLAPLGYKVLEAATAEDALRCLEVVNGGVNLLIADVNLPGGPSGVRVALELRSLLPFLRIILISGVPLELWDEQDAAEWSALPSDSVVTLEKPFHAAELLHSIGRLMGVPMALSGAA